MDTPSDTAPVSMRIRLKYPDKDTFIEKYSANISQGGMFIQSRAPQAVNTTIRFEMVLQDGTPLLKGEGRVIWIKEYDASQPNKVHGMGVRFLDIDDQSEALVAEIMAYKQPGQPRIPSTHTQEVQNLIQAVASAESEEPEEVEESPGGSPRPEATPPRPAAPQPPRSWTVQGPRSPSRSLAAVQGPGTAPQSEEGSQSSAVTDAASPAAAPEAAPAEPPVAEGAPSPSAQTMESQPAGSNGVGIAVATAEEMLAELLRESAISEEQVAGVLSLILAGAIAPEGERLEELEQLLQREPTHQATTSGAAAELERMLGSAGPSHTSGAEPPTAVVEAPPAVSEGELSPPRSADPKGTNERFLAAPQASQAPDDRTPPELTGQESHTHGDADVLDADGDSDDHDHVGERGDSRRHDTLPQEVTSKELEAVTVEAAARLVPPITVASTDDQETAGPPDIPLDAGEPFEAQPADAGSREGGDWSTADITAEQDFEGDEPRPGVLEPHAVSGDGFIEFAPPIAPPPDPEDDLDPQTDPQIQAHPAEFLEEDPATALSEEVWREVVQEASDQTSTDDTVQESVDSFDQNALTFQEAEGEILPVDQNLLFGGSPEEDNTSVNVENTTVTEDDTTVTADDSSQTMTDGLLQADDTLPPDPALQDQIFRDLAGSEPADINETIPSLESLADYDYAPEQEEDPTEEEKLSIKPRKSGLFDRIFGKKD